MVQSPPLFHVNNDYPSSLLFYHFFPLFPSPLPSILTLSYDRSKDFIKSAISSRFMALLIRDPVPLEEGTAVVPVAAAGGVLDDMSCWGSNFRDGDDCLLFRLAMFPLAYRSVATVDCESTVILF